MTKAEDEEKLLENIFGSKVTIKNLKLGDLIYLKDSLNISCKAELGFTSKKFRTAIKEGYNWRKITDINTMYPEQALYLDCLIRLNEIYDDICISLSRSLDNMIIK